ncbi:MAG: hypothetical protein ACJAZR_002790 [Sediminicola sp.]|jgi:uncharacterized protein (TIGR02453 family)
MNFKILFAFLRDLEKNNSKEWMDANRKRYHDVRDGYISWLDDLNRTLEAIDKDYYSTPGKKGINRINNNLMFHPNKPVYKDHFGAGLDKAPNTADFYIQIGIRDSMLAGGFWRPDSKTLQSIRDGIDYDGEEFKKIIRKKSFQDTFGGLVPDQKLKMAPKGFPKEHLHLDLLKNKTFAVMHSITENEILQDDFNEKVVHVYKEMLPFRHYLNKTVTV